MSRHRKAKQYIEPSHDYMECRVIKDLNKVLKDLNNSLIELSRLETKNNEMETTIKQLNKKISDQNNLPPLESQPIMEIKNGTHSLRIYPHSETMKTTTKLRSAIKEFMLLTF